MATKESAERLKESTVQRVKDMYPDHQITRAPDYASTKDNKRQSKVHGVCPVCSTSYTAHCNMLLNRKTKCDYCCREILKLASVESVINLYPTYQIVRGEDLARSDSPKGFRPTVSGICGMCSTPFNNVKCVYVLKGYSPCSRCNVSGFDRSIPARMYICGGNEWGVLKFGISNSDHIDQRIRKHAKTFGPLLWVSDEYDGRLIQLAENDTKKHLKGARERANVPTTIDGHTESVRESEISVYELAGRISAFIYKQNRKR